MSEESFGTFKALFSRPAAFGPYDGVFEIALLGFFENKN